MTTDKQKEIPKGFVNWLKEKSKDNFEKIDVEHEYDRALTTEENMSIFKKKYSFLINDLKEQKPVKVKEVKPNKEQIETQKLNNNISILEQNFGVKISFVK